MTAAEFSDLQEALMYCLGSLASWWLVLVFAGAVILSITMMGLGFARLLFSKRVGNPQSAAQ